MRTPSLLLTLAILTAVGGAARADLDYFVVSDSALDQGHVFTYDTVAKSVAYVSSATMTSQPNNATTSAFALPGFGFLLGESGSSQPKEGAERFITTDQATWASDLVVDIAGETGTGEFFDNGIRTGVSTVDPAAPAAAMLKDDSLFMVDSRSQSGNRLYGVGSVAGLSGEVTAVFPSDAQHLGILNDSTGSDTKRHDVTSTMEGVSNRFVTAASGTGGGDVMVCNSDGTYKGDLTRLRSSDIHHGLGNFKSSAWGDVILQVNSNRAAPATVEVDARSVADADFDSQLFTFTVPTPGSGDRYIEARDVDGTASGLIMVLGELRGLAGGDQVGVQFFETTDGGTTWTATTTNAFRLVNVTGAPVGMKGEGIAGLYPVPEPTTLILFALGCVPALLRRRRR